MGLLRGYVRRVGRACSLSVCLRPKRTITLGTKCLIARIVSVIRGRVEALVLSTSTTYRVPSILRVPCHPPLGSDKRTKRGTCACHLSSYAYLTKSMVKSCSFSERVQVKSGLCFVSVTVCSVIGGGAFGNVPLPSVTIVRRSKRYRIVERFKCRSFGDQLS